MNNLIYSSAVLTLSQTTEFMRNKSVDNTVVHLVVQKGLKVFTIQEVYDSIHSELPIRFEEIEKSLKRSIKTGIVHVKEGDSDKLRNAKLEISQAVYERLDAQCDQLKDFIKEATNELFGEIVTEQNRCSVEELLIETVTSLMAKYGYAYAGQLAGIGDATDFVPIKELKEICKNVLSKYKVKISQEELSEAIGILFDRRDPCLNNLAFSICNRYYLSRLIGLDLPIDFLTKNIYKDSTIYLDTNFISTIAFSRSKGHNEFREILKKSSDLGIRFVASELTIAEIHARVKEYMDDLMIGEEIIPEELLQEVREDIIQTSHSKTAERDFNISESEKAKRLKDMGVEIIEFQNGEGLFDKDELNEIIEELRIYDRKYRSQYPAKDERALFHDAYHYFLVKKERVENEVNSGWFLTMDHSVIEHAITKKIEDAPPYAIRLLLILQTLSQFVESQALKGEFADLFGELVAKDLLPGDKLFNYDDLKLLIGFDIKAKAIPPEFVRKATHHIKKNILKGGGITDENKSEVIHEFTKFLSTAANFVEIQRRYDKKLRDRDDDIKLRDKEIIDYQVIMQKKEDQIQSLIDKVESLELNQRQEKFDKAMEVCNKKKETYVNNQWKEQLRQSRNIRKRYIIFLSIALLAFTLVFFSNSIVGWFNKTFVISYWIQYTIALIVFLSPFIRSLFEPKKVLHGFRLWSSNYREKAKQKFVDEAKKEYVSYNKAPVLEDFLDKEID